MNKSIIIIGKPDSSKTTFKTNLVNCLRSKKKRFSTYKPIRDLTAIQEAKKAMAIGENTKTTPTEKNVETILPVQLDKEQVDLCWPDYGGEQIKKILLDRNMNELWVKSIKSSNNWLFFIRPTNLKNAYDLSSKQINEKDEMVRKHQDGQEQFAVSDQSEFIELLQFFLHVKEHDYHFKNKKVKLTVAMTCWDEIAEDDKTPIEVLSDGLPLLFNFINSNWDANYINVIGLSALGHSLDEEKKKLVRKKGPEDFAYFVKGKDKIYDLTEVILEAL